MEQAMKRYTILVTEEELAVIGSALGGLPYKFAAPVIQEIDRQIAETLISHGNDKPEQSSQQPEN
jgi:hypothetical protein